MKTDSTYDSFEPGDRTALICVDDSDLRQLLFEELALLNYKLHTGLFAEDIALKLSSQTYNIILINENFAGHTLQSNPILEECAHLTSHDRRKQFILLIGPSLNTNDNVQAFKFSVDMVCNDSDLPNLLPLLNRGLLRHEEKYRAFNDCMKMIGASHQ